MASHLTRLTGLGFLVLGCLASTSKCLAGHDLFTQLVVSEQINTGLDRLQSPVSIGIPLPSTSEIQEINQLVLVGSTETQYQIKNRWPNGAIRWVLIDAIVDIPDEDGAITLQLTTGQAPPTGRLIAIEADEGFLLDTGKVQFEIAKEGPGILSQITVEGQKLLQNIPFSLSIGNELTPPKPSAPLSFKLEQNGPVKAVVSIEKSITSSGNQITIVTYLTTYLHQSQIEFEIGAIASPDNKTPIDLPSLTLITPLVQEAENTTIQDNEEGFYSVRSPHSDRKFLLAHDNQPSDQASRLRENNQRLSIITQSADKLPPGSIRRLKVVLDVSPKPGKARTISSPLVGRATSIETYNDSFAFHDKLLPEGQSDPSPITDETFNTPSLPVLASSSLKKYLQAIDETYVARFGPAEDQIENLWKQGMAADSFPGEGPGVWPMATGAPLLEKAYRLWGRHFLNQITESPEKFQSATTLHHLVDLYSLTNDSGYQEMIWQILETWLLPEQLKTTATTDSQPQLLSAISAIIQLGGFSPQKEDQLYDLLESLLVSTPKNHRGERWFYEAYFLTGDSEIIIQGQEFLDRTPQETSQNLAHLIKAPLRYRIWKPLTITQGKEESPMNSSHWKVPVRAERYRFKLASTPMTLSIVKSEPGLKRFHEGINISDEPTPNQSGTIQRYPIAHENTLEPNPNNYIAARYLERGPALPAPEQSKSSTEAPSFEDKGIPWTSPRRLLQTAGSAVTLALILMLWKRRKASSNSPLVILLLAVSIAGCQPESYEEISTTISGRISDAINADGLGNVTIRTEPPSQQVTTNND
ncbi:MAG: hypothetical protein HOI66_22950, partial [Verrucomicrobia bacterium]|nr:hypothetical protein [Verrucomicrobiota bacterium]